MKLAGPFSTPCSMDEHMLAVAGPLELHDDAGEGRRRAAGRGVFTMPQPDANMRACQVEPLWATSFV